MPLDLIIMYSFFGVVSFVLQSLLSIFYVQDREIMRVLVECCLQEKVFNKYYTILASKLCEHDKNHKFTLQVFLSLHLSIKMVND